MTLELNIETVQPDHDYTAVCYTVRDEESGEAIWRTANRTKAEELVQAVNSSQLEKLKAESLRNQLAHLQANYQRQKERLAAAVLALRKIANSHAAADFGRGVALGCLADIGLRSKMPAKRKAAKKSFRAKVREVQDRPVNIGRNAD